MSRLTHTGRPLARGAFALVLAASVGLAGCAPKVAPEVSTPWPVAEKERVAERPAEPPRWPYTGKKAPSAEAITRRPLSIKIENSSASRPQTGIGSADVVYESIAEGGITRFNCIFHSKVPDTVGPVRSARLSDLWIVPQYDGLFFFSGASASVEREVNEAGLPNLSQDAGVMAPYSRSSARSAPHNLFLDTAIAYDTAKSRGMRTTSELEPLAFERRSAEDSSAVTEIDVPFSTANRVKWVFKNGKYRRYNNGAEHQDAGLGKQVTADNVVVLWAKYEVASRDMVGSTTYRVKLGGKGRVSVFRNGMRFDGTWHAGDDAPPEFTDEDDRPIKLTPGRTWFQVLPLDGTITMK